MRGAWVLEEASYLLSLFFFFQAEDGIRDLTVTGVQTCALPIWPAGWRQQRRRPAGRAAGGIVRRRAARWPAGWHIARGSGLGRRAGSDCHLHQQPCQQHGRCSSRLEEHTSELQSQSNLVCRLLLEKKKKQELQRHSAASTV